MSLLKFFVTFKHKLQNLSKLDWFLILLVVLGSGLRLWKIGYFPLIGATQDEVAWTLLGTSLLQLGVPISWSHFAGYQVIETLVQGGNQFPLVKPVLDHPPLFSLIPGLTNTILGGVWNQIPNIRAMRLPMVGLSTLNLGLFVYWLRRQKLPSLWLIVSAVIAATAPSIVFLSRLVVSENLLVTWLLLALILAQIKEWNNWQKWLLLLVQFALPLTKVSGLAIWAGSVAWGWSQEKKQFTRWSLLGGMLGLISALVYFGVYDWRLFLEVQLQQSQRTTGLLTLFSTWLWQEVLVKEVLLDIWNWVGVLGVIILAFAWPQFKSERRPVISLVLWLFIAQLAFYLISVGEHTFHGWYKIPFWPLWSFAIGWLVWQIYLQKNIFLAVWLGLISLAQIRLGLIFVSKVFYQWQGSVNKLLLLLIGSMLLGYLFPKQKRWQQGWLWIGGLLLVLVVLSHCSTIFLIEHESFWQEALYFKQGIKP